MAPPSPKDLVSLLVSRGSISERAAEGAGKGASEAIGEGATNAILKMHPLLKTAATAIAAAVVVALLLGIPLYLCCRGRRNRSEGRYQQMKSGRDGGGRQEMEEEAKALVE